MSFKLLSPASPPSLLRSFGGLEVGMQLKPPKLHRSVGGEGKRLGEGVYTSFRSPLT